MLANISNEQIVAITDTLRLALNSYREAFPQTLLQLLQQPVVKATKEELEKALLEFKEEAAE